MPETKRDILTEICEKRRADMEAKGLTFGHAIPEIRERPVVPFLAEPGTILEIKRSSPSKGMIAPDLKADKTAKSYIKAGTKAISCLTEERYFNGSLEDLIKTCKTAGKKCAVLRKDFLLEPDEIEISYKCGCDAVLLIARILEENKLFAMAEKAFAMDLTVLLELREDSDIEKACKVLEIAEKLHRSDRIILGINSRDLATFKIDLLIPLKLKERISNFFESKKLKVPAPRIISESGVSTPESAKFVGSVGFHGVLIGEAAARNPKKAKELVKAFKTGAAKDFPANFYAFWKKLAALIELNGSSKPLVKICGLTQKEDAVKAAELGASILGFIFAEKSPRTNSPDDANKISGIRRQLEKLYSEGSIPVMPLLVGVIVDPASEHGLAAYEMFYQGILDGIQFHGCGEYAQSFAGYPVVPVSEEADLAALDEFFAAGFPRILIDAKNLSESNAQGDVRYGGTGKCIPEKIVAAAAKKKILWLSGGISLDNAASLVKSFSPELIDVNSSLEVSAGKKDHEKMQKLFKIIEENSK